MIFRSRWDHCAKRGLRVNTPSSVSRSPVILPPSIDTLRRVSCGRPRYWRWPATATQTCRFVACDHQLGALDGAQRARQSPPGLDDVRSRACRRPLGGSVLSAPIDSACGSPVRARGPPSANGYRPFAVGGPFSLNSAPPRRLLIRPAPRRRPQRSSVKLPGGQPCSTRYLTCLIRTTMFVMTVVRPPRRRLRSARTVPVTRFATAQRYYYSCFAWCARHHSGW